MRTRVKICGITRVQDARDAAFQGADAIGLVFYPPSPRAVTVAQAREIAGSLPPFVSVVGLFVNADPQQVSEVLSAVPIDTLQFHGEESVAACEIYGKPYVKAVRVRETTDLREVQGRFASASGLLLDTYQPGTPGGTGTTFDWSLIPHDLEKPIVLAGGLTPENVGKAVEVVGPYAVDVSGGVEASRKGTKDPSKIKAFIKEVQHAGTRRQLG